MVSSQIQIEGHYIAKQTLSHLKIGNPQPVDFEIGVIILYGEIACLI